MGSATVIADISFLISRQNIYMLPESRAKPSMAFFAANQAEVVLRRTQYSPYVRKAELGVGSEQPLEPSGASPPPKDIEILAALTNSNNAYCR